MEKCNEVSSIEESIYEQKKWSSYTVDYGMNTPIRSFENESDAVEFARSMANLGHECWMSVNEVHTKQMRISPKDNNELQGKTE